MTTHLNPTTFTTPSDREIGMERVFDAPRERVFKAHTAPQSIPHWCRRGSTITVDKMDVRPGHVSTETVRFEEHAGKTKLTATFVFQSAEDRDGLLKSGMEAGAVETWDRLAELLLGGAA